MGSDTITLDNWTSPGLGETGGSPMLNVMCTDVESDSCDVILTVAVPNMATYEILIPKSKYDAWRVLELVDQHRDNGYGHLI